MKAIYNWKAMLGLTVSLAIPTILEEPLSARGQEASLPPWQRPVARRDMTRDTTTTNMPGQYPYPSPPSVPTASPGAVMPGMPPMPSPVPSQAYPPAPAAFGSMPHSMPRDPNLYHHSSPSLPAAGYPSAVMQPAYMPGTIDPRVAAGAYPQQHASWQAPGNHVPHMAQQANRGTHGGYDPMSQRDPLVTPVYYQDPQPPVDPQSQAPMELTSPAPQAPPNPMGTEMIDLSILEPQNAPKPPSNNPPLPPLPSRVPSRYSDSDLFEEIRPDIDDTSDVDSSQLSQSMVDYSIDEESLDGEGLEELEGESSVLGEEVIGGPGLLGSALARGANFASRGGLIGGVEATFLAPTKDSLQTLEMENLVDNSLISSQTDFGFGSGIRTWAGIQSDAVGFRATYWSFDHSYFSPQSNIDLYSSPSILNSYSLDASTIDIELLNSFCFGRSTITTSLGGRFANLDREGAITGHGKLGDVHLTGISRGVAELDGWGVVASVEGRHPLQRWFRTEMCEDPPLHLFWKLQGAGLQAETQVMAITEAHAISGGNAYAVAFSRDEALTTWDGTVLTGMLQAGLDYRIPIAACHRPTFLDLRAGFEAQVWQTGEVGAESQSDAFLVGQVNGKPLGGEVRSHSLVNPSDIGLFGFTIGASLSY